MMRRNGACVALGALGWLAACGGGGSPSAPVAVVTPTPVPSPSPSPSPSPVVVTDPEPSPSPEINDNDAPVFRVGAGVYYVSCNGEILEHSRNAEDVDVGCDVHLDATAKDEDGLPTNPRYTIRWHYSDEGALDVRGANPMGPIIEGTHPHEQTIYVHVDGIDSNKFTIRFH